MSGKRWAAEADGGSIGRLSCPVWVDVMLAPLGMVAVTPGVVGCLFNTDVWFNKKWPVQPVSAMAMEVW